jgi:hypothetical protein
MGTYTWHKEVNEATDVETLWILSEQSETSAEAEYVYSRILTLAQDSQDAWLIFQCSQVRSIQVQALVLMLRLTDDLDAIWNVVEVAQKYGFDEVVDYGMDCEILQARKILRETPTDTEARWTCFENTSSRLVRKELLHAMLQDTPNFWNVLRVCLASYSFPEIHRRASALLARVSLTESK